MNPQSIRYRIQEIVARRVSMFRIAKRLTQEGLAKLAGLNYTYIGKIENGKRLPSLEVICRLADALEIEAHELLVPEETKKTSNYTKEQLIRILKKSTAKQINRYYAIITTLHKKSLD